MKISSIMNSGSIQSNRDPIQVERNRDLLAVYISVFGIFPDYVCWKNMQSVYSKELSIEEKFAFVRRFKSSKVRGKVDVSPISGLHLRTRVTALGSAKNGISIVHNAIGKLCAEKKIVFQGAYFSGKGYEIQSSSNHALKSDNLSKDTSRKSPKFRVFPGEIKRRVHFVKKLILVALISVYRELLLSDPKNYARLMGLLSFFRKLRNFKQYIFRSQKTSSVLLPVNMTLVAVIPVLEKTEIDYLEISLESGLIRIIPIIHDLIPLKIPQYFQDSDAGNYLRYLNLASKCDEVYAVSETTKREYEKWSIFSTSKRLGVLDLGVLLQKYFLKNYSMDNLRNIEPIGVRLNQADLVDPYLLMISTIEPRKGHVQLVKAFEQLLYTFPNVKLVLLGHNGWSNASMLSFINSSEARKNIIHLSELSESEKITLIKRSIGTVYCSTIEGYGLPIAESLLLGVRTVVHHNPPMSILSENKDLLRTCDMNDWREITKALEGITHEFQRNVPTHSESQKSNLSTKESGIEDFLRLLTNFD